jgi:hypothetical protein
MTHKKLAQKKPRKSNEIGRFPQGAIGQKAAF